jgi:DNA helicase-2/ATP-dependent DNA helicase PcrA
MVGDPKQAIYVWNGANPKYLDLFQRDFKAGMIELTETFRSAQAVVAAAQRLDASYTVEGQLPIPSRVIGSILPHSAVAKAEELWEAEQERKKKRPRKHRK